MTKINEYLIVDEFKDIPLSDLKIPTTYSVSDKDIIHISITVKADELLNVLPKGEN